MPSLGLGNFRGGRSLSPSNSVHEGVGDGYVREGMGRYEEGCKCYDYISGDAWNQEVKYGND